MACKNRRDIIRMEIMRAMCFTASVEDTVVGYGHLPYFYCPSRRNLLLQIMGNLVSFYQKVDAIRVSLSLSLS